MKIKHYDHAKATKKKKELLYQEFSSNEDSLPEIPLELDSAINSLYSIDSDKEEQIDKIFLKEDKVNEVKKEDSATEDTTISKELKEIEREKEETLKKLAELSLNKTNERIEELEEKFSSVLNKLSSDSLILLNSLDVEAFKKEISYYIIEFAEKDKDFKIKIKDMFDDIEDFKNPDTKKEIKKRSLNSSKEIKKNKLFEYIGGGLIFIIAIFSLFYYITGGFSSDETSYQKIVDTIEANDTKESTARDKKIKEEIIIKAVNPEEANFLVETKGAFVVECVNGYRKRFTTKKRLKGHIENNKFYFKSKQDDKDVYCYIYRSSIRHFF